MADQKYYDKIAEEIRGRKIIAGLWARALAESGGQEDRARAIYISLRLGQLKAESKHISQKGNYSSQAKSLSRLSQIHSLNDSRIGRKLYEVV